MIVIADTSPLNYLILVDLTQILPDLFGQVLIPQAVLQELQSTSAPEVIRHQSSARGLRTQRQNSSPSSFVKRFMVDISLHRVQA